MADDRKKRNLELLRSAVEKDREAAEDEAPQQKGRGRGAPRSGGGAPGSGGGGGGQIMYRGQPVGRGSGGGAPGSPGGGGGGGRRRPAPKQGQSASGDGDVKEALRKLTQLFTDGLITTAEYDAKRAEILNRL